MAEARDVLEGVLAVDRADIAAVTQRRRLAEQDQSAPGSARPSERLGRCDIPDWFDQLRDHARAELAEAEQRAAANTTKRERLETELDAAQSDLRQLDQPTRRQREELFAAQHEVDNAKREHEVAEHRLERSGLRGRRQARRDVAAAHNRFTWANHTLEHLQAQTSPDVDRFHQTAQHVRGLHDELRGHGTIELLDQYTSINRIPGLKERLDALDMWWRFANGGSIGVKRLSETVDIFTNVDGDQAEHHRWLADAVEQHCLDADLHLPTPEHEGIRDGTARPRPWALTPHERDPVIAVP